MSRVWTCLLVLSFVLSGFAGLHGTGVISPAPLPASRAAPGTDVNISINFPYPGLQINESDGLVVNVTVGNSGSEYVNNTFNVTLYIQNENNIFHKFLDQFTVDGLGAPGNTTTFSFKNWTDLFISGDYVINVTTHLFNDSVPGNDTALLDLHVDPVSQPVDMALDSARVLPPSGKTDTPFNFSVTYTFDYDPQNINVSIDGVSHPLLQADISDVNPADGKDYYFITKIPAIGLHTFKFQASYGDNNTASSLLSGPWVNLTIQNPDVRPGMGNITDIYNFTMTYGDFNNNPNPEITLNLNQNEFEFRPINPYDEDYSDANNNFFCRIFGYEVGIGPFKWTITAKGGDDELTVGPFDFPGPSNNTGFLDGNVKRSDGFDLKDAEVRLLPLNYVTKTDGEGNYHFEVPTGHHYKLLFSKEGYYNVSVGGITIPKDVTVYRNANLTPLPVGGDISGWIIDALRKTPVKDALVTAGTAQGDLTATSDNVGFFKFTGIQEQNGVNLSVSKEFFVTAFTYVDVAEAEMVLQNFTIHERSAPFSISPANSTMNISVDTLFEIDFRTPVNISTFNFSLVQKNAGGTKTPLNVSVLYDNETYTAKLDPDGRLKYITDYRLDLYGGLLHAAGGLYLWRDFGLNYRTSHKPLENITHIPAHGKDEVPVNTTIIIDLDVEADLSTINFILKEKDGSSVNGDRTGTVYNNSATGLVHTKITYTPHRDLKMNTIYSVHLLDTLTDTRGHFLLEEDMIIHFRTIKENVTPPPPPDLDSDNDTIPDVVETALGLDPYRNDTAEDPDSDGLTNLEEYTLGTDPFSNDTDGDGMPDKWEIDHGFNPKLEVDGGMDADSDGHTNVNEFINGTDPWDDKDPGKGTSSDDPSYWFITAAIIGVLLVLVVIIIAIVMWSRREIKEEDAEAEEEELINGYLQKKRHKADKKRSREEEEVVEESESLDYDLEEAERAFMGEYSGEDSINNEKNYDFEEE